MKRIAYLFSALVLAFASSTFLYAQDENVVTPEVYESDVNFTAMMPTSKRLSTAQKENLQKKVEKIIARANAGIVSESNVFGIEADIAVKDSKTSAGLLRDVSVVTADVTLTAKNTEDGSVYYSSTIEVQADAIGKESEALEKLISGIKVTDPAFVRFIRTARKRVVEYYNARGLPLPIRKEKEPEVVHDTVTVENTVFVETPVAADVDAASTPAVPASSKPAYDIKISTDNLDFKVVSCTGNQPRQRITIVVQINNRRESTRVERSFNQAFTDDGTQLHSLRVNENYSYEGIDFPRNISMKKEFYIKDVENPCSALSFLRFSIGSTSIEVRNLSVDWQ